MGECAEQHPGLLHGRLSRSVRILVIGGIVAMAIIVAAVLLLRERSAGKAAGAEPSQSDIPKHVGNAIEVTPAFVERTKIQTSPVTRGPLAPLITVVGAATFDPTHVAAVGTRAPGIVTKVFHVEGDPVEKGDVLAVIEAPHLADAQADMRIAAAKERAAELNANRERELFARGLTTAREKEQAEAALVEQRALAAAARERVAALGGRRSNMGVSELRAPVSGIVAQRSISAGQNVGEGLIAFRVGDVDELWVVLRVFERHVGLVKEGDPVEIRRVSDAERVVIGKVAYVGAVLDDTTRTADVRVKLDDGKGLLRPGQAVEATIRASGASRVVLSVPKSALTYVDGTPTVFVAETSTRFVPRNVKLGIDGGDRIEIDPSSAVSEGDAVVTENVLALKSELYR